MLIAYHNPWVVSAENQAFMSLAIAGRKRGIEVVHCASHEELSACRPEFVLSVSSSVAKMVDIPSYLTVHAPKAFFLETPGNMRNLLTYDGYLTISDTLDRFIRDLCFGVGRRELPGFFYNTPQVNALHVNWDAVVEGGGLAVAYFGSNWDRRFPDLFRALDGMGFARVHGPEDAWRDEGLACYRGSVPFDGNAPQRVYAECGMGLALLAEQWRRGNVISNRIFEIASVGAVGVCPDMPWIRKWFGGSVLYFNPADGPDEIAGQIRACYDFCRADPAAARDMGARARAVFEAHFSAEVMLDNLVAYHERKMCEVSAARATMPAAPEISVVVRCGGRSVDFVRRAVDSIRGQTYGSFRVILMKYGDINLSGITADLSGAVVAFTEVSIPGGGRAEMLFAGVRRVETEYFAVLDDDDLWLSHHFEDLFRAGRALDARFDIAFSGLIAFDFPIFYRPTQSCDRNVLLFGFETAPTDWLSVVNAIGTNCFVARRDLVPDELLDVPAMDTAEDSLLIALLSRRSKPVFSYRATAFFRRHAEDGSNWAGHPNRTVDECSLVLRAQHMWAARWLAGPSIPSIRTVSDPPPPIERFVAQKGVVEDADVIIFRSTSSQLSMTPTSELELIGRGVEVLRTSLLPGGEIVDPDAGEITVRLPNVPWGYGARITPTINLTESSLECLIVLEFLLDNGAIGVGLLNKQEDDFIFRVLISGNDKRIIVHIPVHDLSAVGRVVIQNWAQIGANSVAVTKVEVFR